MKRFVTVAMMSALAAAPAFAQQEAWLTRCNRELTTASNAPETGKYIYQTRGKVADPAQAVFDFTGTASATGVVYPSAAKDLLSQYSGPSLSVSYFGKVDAKAPESFKPTIGQISVRAVGREFNPIPGDPVSLKLVIDGKDFGPWPFKESSSGMYSIWFDTAETDGDGKPPQLPAREFAKLAKAVDGAKAIGVVLLQGKTEIAKASPPITQLAKARDGMASWAGPLHSFVGAATSCRGDNIVN